MFLFITNVENTFENVLGKRVVRVIGTIADVGHTKRRDSRDAFVAELRRSAALPPAPTSLKYPPVLTGCGHGNRETNTHKI